MSHNSRYRQNLRRQRRERAPSILSEYLHEHPQTVSPEVARRFLEHGHRKADILKFMSAEHAAKAMPAAPEFIKQQARGIWASVSRERKFFKKVLEARRIRKEQRQARRTNRRKAG